MNTTAPSIETTIARQVHSATEQEGSVRKTSVTALVQGNDDLKASLGTYREKRASTSHATNTKTNNNHPSKSTKEPAFIRQSTGDAIGKLAAQKVGRDVGAIASCASTGIGTMASSQELRDSSNSPTTEIRSNITKGLGKLGSGNDIATSATGHDTEPIKKEQVTEKEAGPIISQNIVNGISKLAADPLRNSANNSHHSEPNPSNSKYANIADKIPSDKSLDASAKDHTRRNHHNPLTHSSTSSLPKYTDLAHKVQSDDVELAIEELGKNSIRSSVSHRDRESAHVICNQGHNNNNSSGSISLLADDSFHDQTQSGAGDTAAAAGKALQNLQESAAVMERLGKSHSLLQEVVSLLSQEELSASVSSIQTFDLHNLYQRDSLLTGKDKNASNEEESEEETEFFDDFDIDSDVDIDDDDDDDEDDDEQEKQSTKPKQPKRPVRKTKSSVTPKPLQKAKSAGQSSSSPRKTSSSRASPTRTPRKTRTQGDKKSTTTTTTAKPAATIATTAVIGKKDDFFTKEWKADFPDFKDPFADASTTMDGSAASSGGFRKVPTREKILKKKASPRHRASRHHHRTSQSQSQQQPPPETSSDTSGELQMDASSAQQIATTNNQSNNLDDRLKLVKKATLERGPSASSIIANKIRNNPTLLEQFLEMVKDDEAILAQLGSKFFGSPVNGSDAPSQLFLTKKKAGWGRSLTGPGRRGRHGRRGSFGTSSVASQTSSSAAGGGPRRQRGSSCEARFGHSSTASNTAPETPQRNRVRISAIGQSRVEASQMDSSTASHGTAGMSEPEQQSALDRRRGRHAMMLMEKSERKV